MNILQTWKFLISHWKINVCTWLFSIIGWSRQIFLLIRISFLVLTFEVKQSRKIKTWSLLTMSVKYLEDVQSFPQSWIGAPRATGFSVLSHILFQRVFCLLGPPAMSYLYFLLLRFLGNGIPSLYSILLIVGEL